MQPKPTLLRITTVPISLALLLKGQPTYMSAQGFDVHTASADGPERQWVLAEGVPHTVVPMARTIRPAQDIRSLLGLIALMRSLKPHIVHTHTPKAGLLGMCAAWWTGVPVRLHTVAGLPLMETSGWMRRLLIAMERLTYAFAHAVYPNSTGLERFIRAHILDAPKVQVLGRGTSNGLDLGHFDPAHFSDGQRAALRAELGLPGHVPVCCFVGRLVREKGIVELVETILAADIDVRLLLVGPLEQERDPLPAHLLRAIEQSDRIRSVGFQKDIRPYLAASDVFVFPSYREGFPNVLLQAAAMELPALASDINGNNEVIVPGETGFLFPPKSQPGLAAALRAFLALSEETRRELGRNARRHVQQHYDQHYVWSCILEAYHTHLLRVGISPPLPHVPTAQTPV